MDDQTRDEKISTIYKTVSHLHSMAIEQDKRAAEIERHVRDIKGGVFLLILAVLVMAYRYYFK